MLIVTAARRADCDSSEYEYLIVNGREGLRGRLRSIVVERRGAVTRCGAYGRRVHAFALSIV